MEPEISLSCKDLVKTYPGVIAMDHINFELRKGEVHALLGENGAGKSTLIKSIAGAHQCDSGTITIDGKEFHGLTPLQAKEMGVEVVYQEFNQMPSLSVAENIYLTELRGKRIVADQREFERKAAELFKEMNLDLNPKVKVASLTNGYKQMVEIAKAISKPTTKILILDEPTAPLTVDQVDILFRLIHNLKEKGISMIFISHRMPEIFEICDRVTVMRDGKSIQTLNVKDTNREELVSLMVGRKLNENFLPRETEIGDLVLEAKDLCGNGVENISFQVHAGEILGFCGSGRYGPYRNAAPCLRRGQDGLRRGLHVWQEASDPLAEAGAGAWHCACPPRTESFRACSLHMSIKANTNISILPKISRGIFVQAHKETENADQYIKSLRIRTRV